MCLFCDCTWFCTQCTSGWRSLPNVEHENKHFNKQKTISHGCAYHIHEEKNVGLVEVHDQVSILKDLKHRHRKYAADSAQNCIRCTRPYTDHAKTELHGTTYGIHRFCFVTHWSQKIYFTARSLTISGISL